MDNLNIHKASSLYKAFPPEEARRIIRRLEIRYSLKHGRRLLDIVEIELGDMTRQYLSRRIDAIEHLRDQLAHFSSINHLAQLN